MQVIATNRKAFFNYSVIEDYEAGLVLAGPEIKAIRQKHVVLTGSYVKPFTANGKLELWWVGGQVKVLEGDSTRTRKLLMSRAEIERLVGKLTAKHLTIVPLELYIKRGKAKLKIALAQRKKKYDKRDTLKKRSVERDIDRRLNDRSENPTR